VVALDEVSGQMKPDTQQSIYDLATHVGVSTSTVSRVLNGRTGIGERTRKRVLSATRATAFRPKMAARQLTVVLVIDRNEYAAFGGFVSGLVTNVINVLAQHDLSVDLITDHNFARLQDRLIDGILALAWEADTIEQLRQIANVPIVMINRIDSQDISTVATDHHRQGEMAAEYLMSRGHKRIGMICEERDNWGSRERIRGFAGTLRRAGLNVGEDSIVSTDHQPMYGALRRLLAAARPTALFIAGEDMAMEATPILRDVLGKRLPQDISLIGMESPILSQFLAPPLTTISQPLGELAAKATDVLLRQMQENATVEHVFLESRFIERESVVLAPIEQDTNTNATEV